MFKIETITDPVRDYDSTSITCMVKFAHLDAAIPFTARPDDKEEHARLVWEALQEMEIASPAPVQTVVTWDEIRARRDLALAASDWTQLGDVALSKAEKTEAKAYRQALRDLTTAYSTPEEVIFPEKPIFV